MSRTDTPTPFAEGQRNADILVTPTPIAHLCDAYRWMGKLDITLITFPRGWEEMARTQIREMRLCLDKAAAAGEPADRIANLRAAADSESANIPELVAVGRRALGLAS